MIHGITDSFLKRKSIRGIIDKEFTRGTDE